MEEQLYTYKIEDVANIVDGDTYDLRLSVGFYLTTVIRVRLLGVDTPEIYGPKAKEEGEDGRRASEFVRNWLEESESLYCRTVKTDSFGRWLGDIFNEEDVYLSDVLIDQGYHTGREY